ncbi:MAG: zinc ribbon domain-containing protein [Balneolaceae bacterium]
MPTYEYRREDGSVFEYRQGINDKPLKVCPETGQKVTRMISGGGGVVYKGEGWYVTDYKNKSRNGSGGGSAPASGSGPDSGEKEAAAEKKESKTKSNKSTQNNSNET